MLNHNEDKCYENWTDRDIFETLKGYDTGAFLRVFTDQESEFETPGRHDISLTMNLITGVTRGNGGKRGKDGKEETCHATTNLSGALLPSIDVKQSLTGVDVKLDEII